MKKKHAVMLSILFVINASVFSQSLSDKGFIGELGWYYKDGGTVLNGKRFYNVADSYREQKGYFQLDNGKEIWCWLYDTYSYHNGDGSDILHKYLPEYFESCNYSMEWQKEKIEGKWRTMELEGAPESLKSLMKKKNCDVAIYLMMGYWYVVNYDKENNRWFTYMFKTFSY